MITFAATTKKSKRFTGDTSAEEKGTHLERLRQGLALIDDNTERVNIETLHRAPLSMDGVMGGYRFTKEGFSSLCSKLSPNTFGFLKGIDSSEMGAEAKTTLQTKIFNDLWGARSHELEGAKFLVDSSSNKIEAVHSKSYGYVSNVDALDLSLSNISSDETLEYYKVHGRTIDVGIGDPNKVLRMPSRRAPGGENITALKYIQNSEDGSSRFLMGVGLYTFICTNGMKIGKEFNIVDAIHRSNIIENVRHQLRNTQEFDFSTVFSMMEQSAHIRLTDELRTKSYTFLKDRVGVRQAKQFVSDSASFVEGEIPTIYEVHAGITEEAHRGGYSVKDQTNMELTGFNYLQKFAQVA